MCVIKCIQSIHPEHVQEKSTCEALKRCVSSAVLKILIVALALILFGNVFQSFAVDMLNDHQIIYVQNA